MFTNIKYNVTIKKGSDKMPNYEFFDKLRKTKLKRREDGTYVLDNENLNRTLAMGDTTLVLTPDQSQIASFAAMTFLFGLFNINVETFTSIPTGFIATYKKGEEFYGTFCSFPDSYIENAIIELCDENSKEIKDTKSVVYGRIKEIMSKSNTTLVEKAVIISTYIKTVEVNPLYSAHMLHASIQNAKIKFKKANSNNCDDNHKLLCRVIAKGNSDLANALIDVKVEGNPNTYGQNLDEYSQKYDEIMDQFILPGYLSYRGFDRDNNPLNQQSQILNEKGRIDTIMKILGYENLKWPDEKFKNIIHVLNMCSTDYAADMVEAALDKIIKANVNEQEIDGYINEILSVIPATPNNLKEKQTTRDKISHRW